MKIIFIDLEYKILNEVYNATIEALKTQDIVSLVKDKWNDECKDADLIILADAINNELVDDHLKVFGQRTINRKERLEIAEGIDAPVAPWVSTLDKKQLERFIDEHDQSKVVLKYDWSYARQGVYLLDKNEIEIPQDFDTSKDVFMKYLGKDPRTYKAEYVFGQFVGGRITSTPSFEHDNFREAILPVEYWEPEESLNSRLMKLSAKLTEYGSAYISVDLMMDENDKLLIIEINSNGVGRSIPWIRFAESYKKSYPNAILEATRNLKSLPDYRDVYKNIDSIKLIQF